MAPPSGIKRPPKHNVKGRLVQRASNKRRRDDEDEHPESVLAGHQSLGESDTLDIIDPHQQKRKKQELQALMHQKREQEPKMSAKKKKRMEAYIDRKLKKEERVKLIESLSRTQVHDLNLQSSATLGSKQFKTQAERLAFSANLEQSRRARAQDVLKRIKGKSQHLSDSESEGFDVDDGSTDEEKEALELERELVPQKSHTELRPTVMVDGNKAPLFNASGALGVVDVFKSDDQSNGDPQASTSAQTTAASSILGLVPQPQVGRALAVGAKVNIVKRKKKSAAQRRREATSRARQMQSDDEEDSEFDSSDSANDSPSEDDKGQDSDDESWKGIPDEIEASASGSTSVRTSRDDASDDDAGSTSEAGDTVKDDEDCDSDEVPAQASGRTKGSFQAWADQQVLAASGMAPSTEANSGAPTRDDGSYKPLLPAGSGVKAASLPGGISGPLGTVLTADQLPTLPPQRSTHVPIPRTEEMQKQREELPIVKEEDRIMDAIRGHAVVVICGETGSGKTTQIGQFLWEAGWGDASSDNPGMVAITQPRRVAALSTCQRVREELCLSANSTQVAHRIRYSSNTSQDTKLVFMTDGVLLRELASDFLLTKYSVVVIDEAHERGVNTDVLIGVLSRVARLREDMWKRDENDAKPLRLIIMSATLRVADFAENPTLFPRPPPILQVSARQHPVTIHFARRTHADYLEQAYKKTARIHARLPPGGVLIFCTGQNEIVSLCKKLEAKFGAKAVAERKRRQKVAREREEARRSGRSLVDALANGNRAENSDGDEDAAMSRGEVELGDDAEAEDVDLGDNDKDLAADVDDGVYDEDDEEGLESDEDEDKFGDLDLEEDTDGKL
ncbi:putative ATP-dependent RNA helicase DHR1 [Microbotryomycetes sp. JL221]|nr:putative ATP-dependent RNA helicase DHR1 [Microbotryomycetes sp. JL221]